MVVGNADKGDAVAEAMTGLEGVEAPKKPIVAGDVAFIEAAIDSDPSSPAAFATVERVRDAVHDVSTAPTRSSAAAPRSTSTPRRPPTATTW